MPATPLGATATPMNRTPPVASVFGIGVPGVAPHVTPGFGSAPTAPNHSTAAQAPNPTRHVTGSNPTYFHMGSPGTGGASWSQLNP